MCSMPGSLMLSVQLACPVKNAGSSLRGTLFPMYRRAVSVMPRSPPLRSGALSQVMRVSVVNYPGARVSRKQEIAGDTLGYLRGRSGLFQLYEILARVHGLLILDEEFGDRTVLFRLDLLERFHDLDQVDGVACGDLVALLHLYIAVWGRGGGRRCLASAPLRSCRPMSLLLRDSLLGASERTDLDDVLT